MKDERNLTRKRKKKEKETKAMKDRIIKNL